MDKFSELKSAAMAATRGPWESVCDYWSDGDDALISSESRDGMVAIAKIDGGGPDSGYDEPFSTEQQANAAFIAAANPAAVLELLAERDADKKRIAELEAKLATPVQPPDDGLDDCRDMWPSDCGDDFDTGYKFGLWRYEQNIRAAGFKVEGDEQ